MNDSSILPKKKNSRLSPLSANNSNERFSQSPGFNDANLDDNWDEDEMMIALEMDAELNKKCGSSASAKKSSSTDSVIPNKNVIILDNVSDNSSSSSSSSTRRFQLSTSMVRPDQTIKLNTDTQLKCSTITVNSNTDDIMQKWFELCKKKVDNPNVYSNLMKGKENDYITTS